MATLTDAVAAKDHSRKIIKNKSDNKFSDKWTQARNEKLQTAHDMIMAYDASLRSGGFPDPVKKPLEYVDAVAKSMKTIQSGNCFQYACVAFAFLRKNGQTPLDFVGSRVAILRTQRFIGHHVVILGRPKDAPEAFPALEKHKNANEIFVIDGWSNIACGIKTFRKEWKAKLNEWNSNGKSWINPVTVGTEPFDSDWQELFDTEHIEYQFRAD